ncbi:MAG: ABC transporter substrate-binding protein [Clostridia bacterium]
MKKRILFLLAVVMAVVCFCLVGCIDEPIKTRDKIVLNEVTHSIFYAPQYLAIALKYFEEENIEITLVNGGGADKSMTALITGEADIGLMGPEAAIYVYLEGKVDHAVVFGQLTKRDGSFLVGRNEEKGFDYSNLAGKHIIMGRKGGVPAMTLQYVLNKHGYTDGVNITMDYSVQFNMLAPAFSSGTGDYVPLFEPTASTIVKQGKGFIVSSIGAESGEVPYTAYMATKSYVTKNAVKLERFLRAVNKATTYLNNNDNEKIAELLMPFFDGTSKAEIVATLISYKANDTWMKTPSMTKDSFERLQDIMQNANELPKRSPFEKVVDNSIANKIAG